MTASHKVTSAGLDVTILLRQPPAVLVLQVCTTTPDYSVSFQGYLKIDSVQLYFGVKEQ